MHFIYFSIFCFILLWTFTYNIVQVFFLKKRKNISLFVVTIISERMRERWNSLLRALSIIGRRVLGVIHYFLNGIITTWTFFLPRIIEVRQWLEGFKDYLTLKFPKFGQNLAHPKVIDQYYLSYFIQKNYMKLVQL